MTTTATYSVFLKGRELEVTRVRFLAIAEEEARIISKKSGREAYVIDNARSIYDSPVYRVKP